MDFLLYFAVLVIGGLIAQALAPKPPKQKPPTLQDFDLPTAEEGRSIPWIFGTYLITDPNCIWYGDLEVDTRTKDRVKTRTYKMGLQLELCIGPIDAITALRYGGKICYSDEITASSQITINQFGLFGGRNGEGGIAGDFDILFGEPTQTTNDYLIAQLGTPISAFRDSVTIVGRKPSLAANTTYIKAIHPTVRCTKKGWENDVCWYPEKCEIGDPASYEYDLYADSLNLYAWWKLGGATPYANVGAGAGGGLSDVVGSSAPTFDAGRLTYRTEDAQSVRFETGTTMYLRAGIPSGGLRTVGVWVEFDTLSNGPAIMQTEYNPANDNYRGVAIRAGSSGGIWLMFGNGDGVISPHRKNYASVETPISAGRLHFVVFRCATAGAETTIADMDWSVFVDGNELTMVATGGTATTVDWSGGYVNFGCFINHWETITMAGRLDEPFYHDGALSDAEIAELYRLGSTPGAVSAVDMNPAHIIYKVITCTDQGLGEPTATIDDTSFRYAADTFYTEGLGLSTQWRNEGDIRGFIAEVCKHAGAVLSLDPRTGLTQLIPLRDDYTPAALDLLTEDHVIEVVEWQDAADGETVNEVAVEFRQRDGSTGSVSWPNRASIQQIGLVHETMSFSMIPRRALAVRIAKRETLQRSSNLSKGKLRVNRYAWDKMPGRVFRFSHAPEGIEELVVRVIDLDLGTLQDGTITVSVCQDIFSLGDDLGDIGSQEPGWSEPETAPAQSTLQAVSEAPYWQLLGDLGIAETAAIAETTGYALPLVGKPTPLSTGFNIWSRIDPADYAEGGVDRDFAPTATLGMDLDRQGDTFILINDGKDIDLVEVGWYVQIGDGALAEFARVEWIDAANGLFDCGRARLDTTPQVHQYGTRIWFISDNAPDWPRDIIARSDGDAVEVKAQTFTGAGVLDVSAATAMGITFDARAIRPYAPGNITINGETHPVELEGDLTVEWAHRDRVTQGLTHVSQYDATDYGPEAGTTYNAYAYDDNTGALLDSDTGISVASWVPVITSSCTLRIEIEALRDGWASWQRQVRAFAYIAIDSRVLETSEPRVTESGTYRVTE